MKYDKDNDIKSKQKRLVQNSIFYFVLNFSLEGMLGEEEQKTESIIFSSWFVPMSFLFELLSLFFQ